MPNLQNLKPFEKGDKRINRAGRPKSFDALRKLAQKIAVENAGESDVTIIENALRRLAKSKNAADIKIFLEYAYGKPRDEVDITSGGAKLEIGIKQIDYRNGISIPPTGSSGDSSASGEN